MTRKLVSGSVGLLLLITPLTAAADTVSLGGLNDDIAACIAPPPSATQQQTQEACRSLLAALIAIITQLMHQPQPQLLTVNAWLEDPTGQGKELFNYGDQLVINWSVHPVDDLEMNGWNGASAHSDTGIELRPYGNEAAAGIRIARVQESGVFPHVYTWNVTPEGLYGDVVNPGKYYVYVNVASKQQGGYRTGIAGPIWIGEPASGGITVTAPNSGEQWEIGQLNTITWAPYGYNPDVNPANQVIVELLRKLPPCPDEKCPAFDVVGRIMDTGKASLHTYFNINDYETWAEPGQYYVRVRNDLTGAIDMSDAPFTLLPRGADLKINDSDGPITLRNNQPIKVKVTVASDIASCKIAGARQSLNGSFDVTPIPVKNGDNIYEMFASGHSISIECTRTDGYKRYDHVNVNTVPIPANIEITDPNGGEKLELGKQTIISFKAQGVSSYSVALYRNNEWMKWIAKDIR